MVGWQKLVADDCLSDLRNMNSEKDWLELFRDDSPTVKLVKCRESIACELKLSIIERENV